MSHLNFSIMAFFHQFLSFLKVTCLVNVARFARNVECDFSMIFNHCGCLNWYFHPTPYFASKVASFFLHFCCLPLATFKPRIEKEKYPTTVHFLPGRCVSSISSFSLSKKKFAWHLRKLAILDSL